jgi:signal transduction histidine kinase
VGSHEQPRENSHLAKLGIYGEGAVEELVESRMRAVLERAPLQAGGYHLLELIDEVLDLARIESDPLNLLLEDVEANEIIAECVALTAPLAGRAT